MAKYINLFLIFLSLIIGFNYEKPNILNNDLTTAFTNIKTTNNCTQKDCLFLINDSFKNIIQLKISTLKSKNFNKFNYNNKTANNNCSIYINNQIYQNKIVNKDYDKKFVPNIKTERNTRAP